jgi:hypothetical protein
LSRANLKLSIFGLLIQDQNDRGEMPEDAGLKKKTRPGGRVFDRQSKQ